MFLNKRMDLFYNINHIIEDEKKDIQKKLKIQDETNIQLKKILYQFLLKNNNDRKIKLRLNPKHDPTNYDIFNFKQFFIYAYRVIECRIGRPSSHKYPLLGQFIVDYVNKIQETTLYNPTCSKMYFELVENKLGLKYVHLRNKYYEKLSFKDDLEEINYSYFSRIKNAIISGKCNFVFISLGVSVGISDHQNGLLLLKDVDRWGVYVYEPHGGVKIKSIVIEFVNLLINYLTDQHIPIDNHIQEYNKICPIGLQVSTKDNIGLCVMFSYFWLFYVLLCKTLQPDIDIYTIENELLYMPEINTIFYEFIKTIMLKYIIEINQKIPSFIKDFEIELIKHIKENNVKSKPEAKKFFKSEDFDIEEEKDNDEKSIMFNNALELSDITEALNY